MTANLKSWISQLSISTKHDLSRQHFYEGGLKLMCDARVKLSDEQTVSTLPEIVGEMCLHGSSIERQAVAAAFDFESMLALPELKAQGKNDESIELIINWLNAQLTDLALFLGTAVKGDSLELSWMLFSDYGGLTMLDFVKFFAMCKKREFTGDFQYVNTHGVNADFIIDWLNQYCDRRETATVGLEISVNRRDYPLPNPLTPSFEKMMINFKDLEKRGKELRSAYDEKLTEKYKRMVLFEGREIEITDTREKPHAPARRLLDFITNFVTFDETDSLTIIKRIGEGFTSEYNSLDDASRQYFESKGIGLDVHKKQEAQRLFSKLSRSMRERGATLILLDAMNAEFKKGTPQAFCESIGLKAQNNVYPETCQVLAKSLVKGFSIDYYDNLQAMVAIEIPPLTMSDYVLQRSLHFLKVNKFKSIFEEILNVGKNK